MLRRFIAPLIALLALTGCILVEDFNPQWESAKTDSCMTKIAQSLYLSEYRRDPDGKDMSQLARTMTLGKEHFLLLKKDADDAGGRMYRFGVVNGIFQRYRLNPSMRKPFLQQYPNAPVSFKNDTVQLKTLGSEQTELLAEIAAKPDYWQVEDQTLYNVLQNPLCLYEDRDLKKMAEDDKPKTTPQKKPKATK